MTQAHATLKPEEKGGSAEGEHKWTGQRGTRRCTLNFLFQKRKSGAPAGLPTSAVKFGSIVVSLCAAETGRTDSGQVVHRGSGHVNTEQVHLHQETLTGCRFCNGFYALSPKTCVARQKGEKKKKMRRYSSDKNSTAVKKKVFFLS